MQKLIVVDKDGSQREFDGVIVDFSVSAEVTDISGVEGWSAPARTGAGEVVVRMRFVGGPADHPYGGREKKPVDA